MDGDGIEDSFDPDDDNDGFSDVDEIAYGSDPLIRIPYQTVHQLKLFLFLILLKKTLSEGTVVGHLRTVDFDDPNETGVYQYSLLANITEKQLFSVDSKRYNYN